jgi:hypothetical protein
MFISQKTELAMGQQVFEEVGARACAAQTRAGATNVTSQRYTTLRALQTVHPPKPPALPTA